MNVRRRRYGADFRDGALSDLSSFAIQVDPETDRQAWGATARLAGRHRLTLYDDAAYLELALRRGLPLATLDRDLRAAAGGERESSIAGNVNLSHFPQRTREVGHPANDSAVR